MFITSKPIFVKLNYFDSFPLPTSMDMKNQINMYLFILT
jgi:hypothetical protein